MTTTINVVHAHVEGSDVSVCNVVLFFFKCWRSFYHMPFSMAPMTPVGLRKTEPRSLEQQS